MEHLGVKFCKVGINDGPRLTLTYYTARSYLVTYMFIYRKVLESYLIGKSLQQITD